MEIDYCPKCSKAGLRYENDEGLDPSGRTSFERYQAYKADPVKYNETSQYGAKKWCPRCREWVEPIGIEMKHKKGG